MPRIHLRLRCSMVAAQANAMPTVLRCHAGALGTCGYRGKWASCSLLSPLRGVLRAVRVVGEYLRANAYANVVLVVVMALQ